MDQINKNFIIGILVISIAVLGLLWYRSDNRSTVDDTLKCAQLYELKKDRYWNNEIGNSKYIFNKKLNTCLALNIYNDFETKNYFAMIMDMSDDKIILYYTDKQKGFYVKEDGSADCKNSYVSFEYLKNEKEIKDSGCDKYVLMDEMFEQVRELGFEI
jgi:hypothetical protein